WLDHGTHNPLVAGSSPARRIGGFVNQPTQTGGTVLGNFSVDYVDDGPPTPGGCPGFAAMALEAMGHPGRVVARLSRDDLPLFQSVFDRYGELIAPLWTPRTS